MLKVTQESRVENSKGANNRLCQLTYLWIFYYKQHCWIKNTIAWEKNLVSVAFSKLNKSLHIINLKN
jgi:hypothetical protein